MPLMSMVRHRACQESRIPFLLLFSVRTYDDILFREELLTLYARHDGFALALALTRDTLKHGVDFGRWVDDAMLAEVVGRLPAPPGRVFVCGSNPFVEAASEATLSVGIPSQRVRTERYGG